MPFLTTTASDFDPLPDEIGVGVLALPWMSARTAAVHIAFPEQISETHG